MPIEIIETEDVGKLSKFNAAAFQMKRIADLQERINIVSLNPLAMNEQFGVFNYEIWVTSCDSLLQEVGAKLSTKERENIKKVRNKLHAFLNRNPILKEKRMINGSRETKLNKNVWRVTYKAITIYEEYVRELLDIHQMNSPERDDSGL